MEIKGKTKRELLEKITDKKEFSDLPVGDVEKAFSRFDKDIYSDTEKIKLTRNLLREIFSSFTSRKILSLKEKNKDWILNKHLSTRERVGSFVKIYSRVLTGLPKHMSVLDLGAGINGFSYSSFEKSGFYVDYIAVEAMGQLVDLMNDYFKKEKIPAKAYKQSLFESNKIKNIIKKSKEPRVVFLFKVLDSLEMLERDFSKKLLFEIVPFCERVVVSFATESMVKRKKFYAKRTWFFDFVNENFRILDDFVVNGERFVVFEKK